MSRPSTRFLPFDREDVDGRNKSGHDELSFNAQFLRRFFRGNFRTTATRK
jgi:hypothetical protein